MLPYPSLLKHCSPSLDYDFDENLSAIFNKALPACPVIEDSCSKPSVFVNFQLVLNVFPINGRFGLRPIDLVVNTDMVWQYYWEWDDNSRTIYSMLYQENVKNYDQSYP